MTVRQSNKKDDEFRKAIESLRRLFPITEQQLLQIEQFIKVRTFEQGHILTNEGQVEDHLNLVVTGLLRKFLIRKDREFTLQLATEGHLCQSEISYLRRQPSEVVIEALEPTTVLSLSFAEMQRGLESNIGFDYMGFHLLVSIYILKDERHYKQLKFTAREKFLDFMANHPHMLQRVPQKYLASYLNIKPETFSRLKHLIRTKKTKD